MAPTSVHPLKLERERRNLSQRMLADFAQLGVSTILRAEHGQRIGAAARQRVCAYLNKSPEDLGLVTTRHHPASNTRLDEGPVLDEEGEETEMNRRQALQRLGLVGATALFGTREWFSSEPWEQLARALRKSTSIDSAGIGQLEAITQNYWQLRTSMASRELLGGVIAHLQTTTQIVQHAGSSQQYHRLCSIAGEAALIAGQMAFDLNDHVSARANYHAAIAAAKEARNSALHAAALARTSLTYTEAGEPHSALIVLDRASGFAGQTGNGVLGAWVHAIEAEAHASLGDATACQKALARAEEISQLAADASDPYWTGFDASRMASYQGACSVRLGQPAQALAALERSMALMTTPSPRQTPRILVNMATAHVLQGEIEEACRLASEALAMTHQTHNDMVVPRLRKFRKTLDRWQDTAAVRRFDEQFLLV